MALEPDRHREIIPTSYFATRNGGNGRNEGGNGRNGRNEKMEEIVAETASRIFLILLFFYDTAQRSIYNLGENNSYVNIKNSLNMTH